ncbi:hypothetical protein [Levilactobacillus parabrevis]|uniref:hypothetical protein n=1 Tax=Levilactobacillus parabrevis TaxID=357278 RepID=UPI0003659F22|nr:hypothetical protein [Levilactobacillus parabrevis]
MESLNLHQVEQPIRSLATYQDVLTRVTPENMVILTENQAPRFVMMTAVDFERQQKRLATYELLAMLIKSKSGKEYSLADLKREFLSGKD